MEQQQEQRQQEPLIIDYVCPNQLRFEKDGEEKFHCGVNNCSTDSDNVISMGIPVLCSEHRQVFESDHPCVFMFLENSVNIK